MRFYYEDNSNFPFCTRCMVRKANMGVPFRPVLDYSGNDVICSNCGDELETNLITILKEEGKDEKP